MGFNVGVLLLSDALPNVLENREEFVNNLLEAIDAKFHERKPQVFSIGNHANGGTVFYHGHSNMTGLIAIGGNCTTDLGHFGNGGRHHTQDEQLNMLRQLAESLGYELIKKGDDDGFDIHLNWG